MWKVGVAAIHTCNPRAGDVEIGDPLEINSQSSAPVSSRPTKRLRLWFQSKVMKQLRKTFPVNVWPHTHVYTGAHASHTCLSTHRCTHIHRERLRNTAVLAWSSSGINYRNRRRESHFIVKHLSNCRHNQRNEGWHCSDMKKHKNGKINRWSHVSQNFSK